MRHIKTIFIGCSLLIALVVLAVFLIPIERRQNNVEPPSTPEHWALTADQAGILARKLANEKAQVLYNCQPFRDGPPARFVRGRWVWRDRRGHGFADIEATVEFEADGTKPNVNVMLLDSRAMLQ